MMILRSAAVGILFILSISAFPLTNVTEPQLSSPLNDSAKEKTFEVTTRSTYPTWYPTSSTYAPTSAGTPWWVYVLLVCFALCLLCCGGTRAKTGRWVWVPS